MPGRSIDMSVEIRKSEKFSPVQGEGRFDHRRILDFSDIYRVYRMLFFE